MLGFLKGETCNRGQCEGIIDEHEKDGSCSCHLNPPCSFCVDSTEYCPLCGWEGIEEQKKPADYSYSNFIHYHKQQNKIEEHRNTLLKMMKGELPITGFDYINESHTHFSMIKKGVYPADMPKAQLVEKIKGTFGGRFTEYGNGKFTYIAYTD